MDNYNSNLYGRREQLAFAMGVFETKMKYEIGDDDEIFDEFLSRLFEIGEYNIHHRSWIEEMKNRIYDENNIPADDINFYQEYEDACEQFNIIQSFIDRGCVAI